MDLLLVCVCASVLCVHSLKGHVEDKGLQAPIVVIEKVVALK